MAFSEDGQGARGHGDRRRRLRNCRRERTRDHQLRQRDGGVCTARGKRGRFTTWRRCRESGRHRARTLGFGCAFVDLDLDGRLDLAVVNGHIDETVRDDPRRYRVRAAAAPVPQRGERAISRRRHGSRCRTSRAPKVGRGLGVRRFRPRWRSSTCWSPPISGPALLYRNDVTNGNRSLRLRLTGTKSNRDGIGAVVRGAHAGRVADAIGAKRVELPVAVGVGGDVRAGGSGRGTERRRGVAQRADAGVSGRQARTALADGGVDDPERLTVRSLTVAVL